MPVPAPLLCCAAQVCSCSGVYTPPSVLSNCSNYLVSSLPHTCPSHLPPHTHPSPFLGMRPPVHPPSLFPHVTPPPSHMSLHPHPTPHSITTPHLLHHHSTPHSITIPHLTLSPPHSSLHPTPHLTPHTHLCIEHSVPIFTLAVSLPHQPPLSGVPVPLSGRATVVKGNRV